MSNFFTDNADLQQTLRSLDLARIVRLREDDYAQARDFAYAPGDFEDAVDSYARTLEIAGDLAGEYIEPRAEDVDRAGSELDPGRGLLRARHRRGPRAPQAGRPHGHDAAAQVRRPQLPRLASA